MTRALFSISQDVLSSEKQWRKRQLFVNVVDSRSELESVAKLSFTIVFFSSFFRFSAREVFQHTSKLLSKPLRLQAWVSDWIRGSHEPLGSTHLLSVGGLFWCRARFAWRLSGIFHLATEVHTFHQESERSCWKCSQASRPSVHIH